MKYKNFIKSLLFMTVVGVIIDLIFDYPDFELVPSLIKWLIFALIMNLMFGKAEKLNQEELEEAEKINSNSEP